MQASRELSPFEKAEAILDAPWMLEAGGTVMLMKILMSTDSRTVREHQTEFYKVLNEMCIAIFESSTQFEGAPEAVLGEFRDWLEETLFVLRLRCRVHRGLGNELSVRILRLLTFRGQ